MTKIQEIQSFDIPSLRRKKKEPWYSKRAFLIIFLTALVVWLLGMLPDLFATKVEAAEPAKTEAEWETEICENLELYQNQADFRAYCNYRLTN